MGIFFWQTYI